MYCFLMIAYPVFAYPLMNISEIYYEMCVEMKKKKYPYLLRFPRCGLFNSPGRCGGGGDFHDGCGCFRAVGCGARLRCDRGGRLPNQPNAALDLYIGIALGGHVEHL